MNINYTLQEQKSRYISAVHESLISRYHLDEIRAKMIMRKYRLQDRIDRYPYIQFHYDTDDVADDIYCLM